MVRKRISDFDSPPPAGKLDTEAIRKIEAGYSEFPTQEDDEEAVPILAEQLKQWSQDSCNTVPEFAVQLRHLAGLVRRSRWIELTRIAMEYLEEKVDRLHLRGTLTDPGKITSNLKAITFSRGTVEEHNAEIIKILRAQADKLSKITTCEPDVTKAIKTSALRGREKQLMDLIDANGGEMPKWTKAAEKLEWSSSTLYEVYGKLVAKGRAKWKRRKKGQAK